MSDELDKIIDDLVKKSNVKEKKPTKAIRKVAGTSLATVGLILVNNFVVAPIFGTPAIELPQDFLLTILSVFN